MGGPYKRRHLLLLSLSVMGLLVASLAGLSHSVQWDFVNSDTRDSTSRSFGGNVMVTDCHTMA